MPLLMEAISYYGEHERRLVMHMKVDVVKSHLQFYDIFQRVYNMLE